MQFPISSCCLRSWRFRYPLLLHNVEYRRWRAVFRLQYSCLYSKYQYLFFGRQRIWGRTIDSSLHAVSLGCAPTPIQYFALAESNLMSLNGLPSPSVGGFGIGSYVPVSNSISIYLSIPPLGQPRSVSHFSRTSNHRPSID